MSTIDSMMQRTVNRNLLKYAAGTAIFCPLCQAIMDCKRTVVITAGPVTKTCCAQCWDADLKPKIEARGMLERCDVVDGRQVFSRSIKAA